MISLLLFYFLIFTNFVFDFCVLQVGAPPEIAYLLDEIRLVNDVSKGSNGTVASCLGADPELDEFMVSFSSSNFFCSWRSPNPKKRFPISLSLSSLLLTFSVFIFDGLVSCLFRHGNKILSFSRASYFDLLISNEILFPFLF